MSKLPKHASLTVGVETWFAMDGRCLFVGTRPGKVKRVLLSVWCWMLREKVDRVDVVWLQIEQARNLTIRQKLRLRPAMLFDRLQD